MLFSLSVICDSLDPYVLVEVGEEEKGHLELGPGHEDGSL